MPVSMPQFRFPFTKKAPQPTPSAPAEEVTAIPDTLPTEEAAPRAHSRAKSTSSISVTSRREEDTNNYKLSVVNDSGEYLPPSPTEKKSFWGRTNSTTSSNKDVVPDTQDIGFAITRESFDSYRRSFDISARTQVSDSQRQSLQSSRSSFDALGWGRQSMDSKMGLPNRLPSIDVSESASDEDEEFREVDLNDSAPQPKKRGFLGRFVGNHETNVETKQEPKQEHKSESKGRLRSSTTTWRREHNKDAEELSAMVKGSNHLISV